MLKQEDKEKISEAITEVVEALGPKDTLELGELLTEIGFAIQIAVERRHDIELGLYESDRPGREE